MPPCVVRPVGPPARAGEHSKPSCLQARAVRARRSDVLGFEGGAQPQAPEELPQGKGFPRLFVPGRLPPACSFILFFGRSCGPGIWMPRPAHHPSIHPSIQVCLSFTRARDPFLHANHSCIHARRPVALGMRPCLSCTPTCRARFAGALPVIPDLPHPITRGRCDASNGEYHAPRRWLGRGMRRGPRRNGGGRTVGRQG